MIRGSRDALWWHTRRLAFHGGVGSGISKAASGDSVGAAPLLVGLCAKSVTLSAVGASMMGRNGLEGSLTDCPPSDATEYGNRR